MRDFCFGIVAGLLLILPTTLVWSDDAMETPIKWSIVVYSGADEEEIAPFSNRIVEKLLSLPLPSNVELLMEHDTHFDPDNKEAIANDPFFRDGVSRFLRRGKEFEQQWQLPEHDSAAPYRLEEFFRWVNQHSQGEHRVFIVMTHSWGWKGIIQDYNPQDPERGKLVPWPFGIEPGDEISDTMMPLSAFARVIRESRSPTDILFLDGCILGNVEPLEELLGTARYIVGSQRETPYNGFPYETLFADLRRSDMTPRKLAAKIPKAYVEAYARGGVMAQPEGEYDLVTLVTVDMSQWELFRDGFAGLVETLSRTPFRSRLKENPHWLETMADEDWNVDLVELLKRLPTFIDDPEAKAQAKALESIIGYPEEVATQNEQKIELNPRSDFDFFELRIQADEILPDDISLEKIIHRWKHLNADLLIDQQLPDGLDFSLLPEGAVPTEIAEDDWARTLVIRGSAATHFNYRVWLPGTRSVRIIYGRAEERFPLSPLHREADYTSVLKFPQSSFLLSEAHTQGAPFLRGVGINLKPLMDTEETHADDPINGLVGPALYRATAWNRKTGWGDLILLNQ